MYYITAVSGFKGPTYQNIGISDRSNGNIGNTGAVTNNRLGLLEDACAWCGWKSACARSPASRMLCLDCKIGFGGNANQCVRLVFNRGRNGKCTVCCEAEGDHTTATASSFNGGVNAFNGGSDGKCTICREAEGDHVNINGIKFCPECVSMMAMASVVTAATLKETISTSTASFCVH